MTPFSKEYRPLWLRKLHSLTGVFPVGIFLVLHLWTNALAMQGRTVYDARLAAVRGMPIFFAIEVVGIFLPLLFHGAYGLILTIGGSSHGSYRPDHPYANRLAYRLQMASGIAALVFVVVHFWQFRVKLYLGEMSPSDLFTELCATLSATTSYGLPAVALLYLAGIAAAAHHFAYGLYAFCFTWKIASSRTAMRWIPAGFAVLGVALFMVGADTVFFFATGTRLVPW
jgi:succinate dehydrogenase/fumarate reductase cytochrome b subunit (b558 family)